MSNARKACLIYVTATEGLRRPVRAELERAGFTVCEVKADIEDARAAKAGDDRLPPELSACLRDADLCVFL